MTLLSDETANNGDLAATPGGRLAVFCGCCDRCLRRCRVNFLCLEDLNEIS
jgi:hypothetical protein